MGNVNTAEVARSARRMALVFRGVACALILLGLLGALALVFVPGAPDEILLPAFWDAPLDLKPVQIIGLALVMLIGIAGWAAVLWMAGTMLWALSAGSPARAARLARTIALAFWLLLLWHVLAQAMGSAIATWYFPKGQRAVVLSLGWGHIGMILAALLTTTMSKALEFGAELWQDHKEIV